ncbi:MAG: M12 family metallo-peptidase [Thermoanaerobaculia bacterium]|jgi:hypothetical protein
MTAVKRYASWLPLTVSTLLLVTATASASEVTKINDEALAPLRGSLVTKRVTLDALPLKEGQRPVIDLEEFQVWAPGGKVVIHGEDGKVTVQAPTPLRFFRGLVNGDPESFAYFSVDRAGHVYGLVATREHRYAITAQRRPRAGVTPRTRPNEASEELFDHFVTEATPADEFGVEQGWTCDTDKYSLTADFLNGDALRARSGPAGPEPAALTGTQTYGITVEVETDFELYTAAGSNSTTVQNYVTNLTGAVSTIYNRDLKTNVTQSTVNIYTTSSDPWAAVTASAGLIELGDYYHSSKTRTTSAVTLLSGKNTNSGIAWEAVICANDLDQGVWAGPYAWCGSVFGTGTIPDPNSIQNGVQYGMPSGFQNYWPLTEYAHELGHNMAGHHTHCVAISDAERIASGFSDGSPANSTSNFVDHCYAAEGAGCFSGTSYVAGSQTTFKGTIMSYCHNVFSGGFPQSRFIFGVAAEPSHHELDDYMLRASGPLTGLGTNIVSGTTATLSSITAPGSVGGNSTGNVASVTNVGGQTYSWSITGGSITGGGSTNSVTFSAGASGSVVLTVNAVNSTRCSLRDSVTIPISSINAPTGVVATATTTTNVVLSWNIVVGATNYKVLRSSNGSTYGQVGNPSENSFNDPTALANTAYLYKVRANDGSSDSGDSNIDLATTVIFTDPSLTVGTTQVKAVHITQLRTAVNAVRTLASLGAGSYTDPTVTATSTTIKRLHVTDLRTALDAARSALALSAVSYTDPTITASSTLVKAAHVNDLRGGVQ